MGWNLFKKKKAKTKVNLHYLSFHVVLGLGRFDSINTIYFDDKIAWGAGRTIWLDSRQPLPDGMRKTGRTRKVNFSGIMSFLNKANYTEYEVESVSSGIIQSNHEIYVEAENLFGGLSSEGGVKGKVDVMFGESDQEPNPYIRHLIGGDSADSTPNYRGVTGLFFNSFYFGTSPYMKPLSVMATRKQKTYYSQEQWYKEKVSIGEDMNPIHIIREVLTCPDPQWGMNIDPAYIDDDNFRAAADKLYEEQLGLSFLWDKDDSTSAFLTNIYKHINCFLVKDRNTNKYKIRLVREDYDFDNVRVINEDDIAQIVKYSRNEPYDLYNQVTIKYWDRSRRKQGAITGSNSALYDLIGVINSETISYNGCCTEELANRLLARDLQTLSTPLVSLTIKATRSCFNLDLGDIIRVQLKDDNIPDVVYRVIEQQFDENGNYTELKLIQDIFGYPKSINGKSEKVAPPPKPMANRVKESKLFELNKSDLYAMVGESGITAIGENQTNYGIMAERTGNESNFRVLRYVGSQYVEQGTGEFTKFVELTEFISFNAQTIKVPDVSVFEQNDLILIDKERMLVIAARDETTLAVRRAKEDTQIAEHNVGSSIYILKNYFYDDEYVEATAQYFKLLPTIGNSVLAETDATEEVISLVGRHAHPFPPQNIKINGEYFPAIVNVQNDGEHAYIEISCHGRGLDYLGGTHWYSEVNNAPQSLKTYLQIYGVVEKTEITHDGAANKIIIENGANLNNTTLRVWSEDNGKACLEDFEYILKTE